MKTLAVAVIFALCVATGVVAVKQHPEIAENISTWAGGPR